MKTFTCIKLSEFQGKKFNEVQKYIEKNYKDKLANQEDIEHFIKSNPKLSDWTFYFFFGSVVYAGSGGHHVPRLIWNGYDWDLNVGCFNGDWSHLYRVVLFND